MQVGEVYWVRTNAVFCEDANMHTRPRVKGRVIWIHPKRRYAVLELSGRYRECYYPEELTEHNRVGRRHRRCS